MFAATVVTVLVVMPAFLLGAFIVLIREDVAVSDAQLGILISAFFLASSLSSVSGGRLADRIGASTGMVIGGIISVASMLGIGIASSQWWHLAGFMLLGGLGSGVGMSASNLALARNVPRARRGLAFGVKQAAAPMASSFAGLAVPLVGLTIGWRWALLGTPIALFVLFIAMRHEFVEGVSDESEEDGHRAPMLALVLLATTTGFASASATATIGFFVESAVERGFATSTAGFTLGIGSAAGIGARVLWGWLADRRDRGHLAFLSWLLAAGSVGFVLLGVVETAWQLTLASILVFAAGWSWSGLVFLVATLGSPGAPATATGVISAGGGLGGLLGPIVFGALLQSSSYFVAWTVAGVWMIIAAVLARATLIVWVRLLARAAPDSGGRATG